MGNSSGHRAVCAAATQLRGRVDLGWEILPPRPRNGVATHGHDRGAAASEGGDNDVALQAQRKRPRTSSIREVELVRKHLLAYSFPGVQDNTTVPKLKVLVFLTSRLSNGVGGSHELLQEQYCVVAATRLVCPEPGFWKANGEPVRRWVPGVGRGRVGAARLPPPTMSCGLLVCADGCQWVSGDVHIRVVVSCTRLAVPGGLVTHSGRAPPGQPEQPGPVCNSLRPGREHVVRHKPC